MASVFREKYVLKGRSVVPVVKRSRLRKAGPKGRSLAVAACGMEHPAPGFRVILHHTIILAGSEG